MEKDGNHFCSYEESELVYFKEGLFGFEDKKKFIPLPLDGNSDAVLCLQSVEDEELSFVIMNPFLLLEGYHPELSESDMRKLGSEHMEELSFYVICVIGKTMEESTVNMRCPIVVNTVSRQAGQVVLDSEEYGFRHVLKDFKKEEV